MIHQQEKLKQLGHGKSPADTEKVEAGEDMEMGVRDTKNVYGKGTSGTQKKQRRGTCGTYRKWEAGEVNWSCRIRIRDIMGSMALRIDQGASREI